MQTCLKILKSIGIIDHMDRIKKQNDMILLTDNLKALNKSQHSFMVTTFRKLEIVGNFINLINSYKKKPYR